MIDARSSILVGLVLASSCATAGPVQPQLTTGERRELDADTVLETNRDWIDVTAVRKLAGVVGVGGSQVRFLALDKVATRRELASVAIGRAWLAVARGEPTDELRYKALASGLDELDHHYTNHFGPRGHHIVMDDTTLHEMSWRDPAAAGDFATAATAARAMLDTRIHIGVYTSNGYIQ